MVCFKFCAGKNLRRSDDEMKNDGFLRFFDQNEAILGCFEAVLLKF
jgi:hypothetical protein